MVITSVILCGVLISSIWKNWHQHPVTVTFDDKATPISEIPFPAITVCSSEKFLVEKINMEKFTKILAQVNEENTLPSLSPEE